MRKAWLPTSVLSLLVVLADGAEEAVERDRRAGERLGVRSTPTVLINGRRLDGAPPLRILEEYVRGELELQTQPRSTAR